MDYFGTEVIAQREPARIQFYTNPFSPERNEYRHQTVGRFVEIEDAAEIRRTDQIAVKIVRPAMIRTPQILGRAARLGCHRCSMVAAKVEETAQQPIAAFGNDERLFRDITGDVVARGE